ncbi:MAG: hypothetical protein ACE5J7_04900 [Candidatus Aenigmatarchaeota archaeon]
MAKKGDVVRRPIPDYEEKQRKEEERRIAEEAERKKEEEIKRKEDEKRRERQRTEWKAIVDNRIKDGLPLPASYDEKDELIKEESDKVKQVFGVVKGALEEIYRDEEFLEQLRKAERPYYTEIEGLDYYDEHDEFPSDDRSNMLYERCRQIPEIEKYITPGSVLLNLIAIRLQREKKINMGFCQFYENDERIVYRRIANEDTGGLWDACLAEPVRDSCCHGVMVDDCQKRKEYMAKLTKILMEGKLL